MISSQFISSNPFSVDEIAVEVVVSLSPRLVRRYDYANLMNGETKFCTHRVDCLVDVNPSGLAWSDLKAQGT
jgi:hypothetical protein